MVKVDVEPDNGVLESFNAGAVPTYLVFKDGVEVERLAPLAVDWWTDDRLRRRIKAALEL